MSKNKITPFLWFDDRCEEAVNFYCSVFKNSRVISLKRWGGSGAPYPPDKIMTAKFELDGQEYYAFDAGPMFKFNESISMFVSCEDQTEVDYFWEKLISDGGEESMCGWLKDKFGLSWQIVPKQFDEMISSKDGAAVARAFAEIMKMKKLDVAVIQKAFDGK